MLSPWYSRCMKKYLPGLILCVVLAVAAAFLSRYVPLGRVTIAILLGMILRNLKAPSPRFSKGIVYAEKFLLPLAIALMGVSLDYGHIRNLGLPLIVIIISGICMTIPLAVLLGRFFKMDSDLALLVGVGNAVCGSSAIAAAQSVVQADEEKVGLSIAVINFLGTIGIFLLPSLVLFFPFLTELKGGVLIGNCLQAIGQVSAAGFSVSDETGQIATLVKMGRILMIMPLVLALSFTKKKNRRAGGKNVVPWYIWGFLIFSIIGSLNILSVQIISGIKIASKSLLVTAMAAIGMKITLSTVLGEGKQALLLGSIVFFCQIAFSIGMVVLLV